MKIKTNLTLLTLTFIILIVTVSLVMFLAFDRINREVTRYNTVAGISKAVSELSIITHEYSVHHEKRMQQQWLQRYNSMRKLLEKASKEGVHPEHARILKLITLNHKTVGDLFLHMQGNSAKRERLIKENRPQKEIDVTCFLEERETAHLLMSLQRTATEVFKFSAVMQKSVERLQQRAALIVIFATIGFVILSTFISFFVIRTITRPLNELIKGTEIIGKGNLKHRVEVRTKNEIGKLAASFNRMTENLTKVTASRDELNVVNQQLQASEQQLKASNQQLRASEQQLKASNQQLRASEQQLRASNQQLRANEEQLRAEITEREKMEEETKKHLYDLEVFYKASHNREERIVELKKEVAKLKKGLKEK